MRFHIAVMALAVPVICALAPGCGEKREAGAVKAVSRPAAVTQKPRVDPAKVGANEAGRVLILEYHDVGSEEGRWTRRSDNFRGDLQRLCELGYEPVSLRDYVNNNISTSTGKSPVVFTFDDGTKGQFNYINVNGRQKVDPNCAVGIMEKFAQTHKGWPLKATFYVYYAVPFRQAEYVDQKMRRILQLGMDIGNHTYTHTRLDQLTDDAAARELAMNVRSAAQHAPGAVVDSIALPYGKGTKNKSILVSGNYQGTKYKNIAALLVGAEPAPSPVSASFDPYRLPRVQGIQSELDMWLGYFKRHPEKRYVSDGDASTVSVPKTLASEVDRTKLRGKKLRTY